jgi:hypothetical protein
MMKDKSLRLRLSSLFRQPIPGRDTSEDMLEFEKAERVIEDILRWADDGGLLLGIGNPSRPSNCSSTLKPSEPHDR